MSSSVVKNYYLNPKDYYEKKPQIIKLIGDKTFIEIYENFLKNYIENDKLYDRIIMKRMPYGIKGAVISYLCFILNPFGVEMNNYIKDRNFYLESYLIIIFLHETYHFSKRSYYMNKPLSICITPKNYEGGDSIICSIFGEEKISIINTELCNEKNYLDSWNAKKPNKSKILKNLFRLLLKV